MYGDVNCVIYEEDLLVEPQANMRDQARSAAQRYVARPARRAYRTAANHPMASLGGLLAIGGLAAIGYTLWRQYQQREEHYGPLWNAQPRDMRGITMPSERDMRDYATETEPSAASQIP